MKLDNHTDLSAAHVPRHSSAPVVYRALSHLYIVVWSKKMRWKNCRVSRFASPSAGGATVSRGAGVFKFKWWKKNSMSAICRLPPACTTPQQSSTATTSHLMCEQPRHVLPDERAAVSLVSRSSTVSQLVSRFQIAFQPVVP